MKVQDVLGCAASAIVLLLASALIPLVGPVFSLLTPLPFLYYTLKLGLYQGAKVVFITVLAVGLVAKLAGYPQLIFLCLEFSLLGLIISETFRREFTIGFSIFWGTVFMLIIGVVILGLIGLSRNMGPLAVILDYFQNNIKATVQSYEGMGWDQEKILQIQGYLKILVQVISKIYPAIMIVGTGFVVWINIVISRPLFRLLNLNYPHFGPMDRWHAPELMVWGVIAAGFSLFLSLPVVKLIAINGLIVMLAIYVFHGLSILLFFLNKYHVPPWLRIGIYFLIFFQQIFLIVLAMAGLFDQWIDFRKIHVKKAVS
jgi:uncharacterized protein YybS (DUF2232 family)